MNVHIDKKGESLMGVPRKTKIRMELEEKLKAIGKYESLEGDERLEIGLGCLVKVTEYSIRSIWS